MDEETEQGSDEEESDGPSLTKKVATGVALSVATTAVAAGARKLLGDSGDDEGDSGEEDVGDESGESSEGSSSQLASTGSSAKRSTAKRSSAKRSTAKR